MKIAAYQAPLLAAGSMDALGLIRARLKWCEAHDVTILCCPEAILGGLADYAEDPMQFAIPADHTRLEAVLAPFASDTVTTIVGFTELAPEGQLYNSAAVLERGSVVGVYRKVHPAINRSIYQAGSEVPVFRVQGITFGIVICNDSNYPEIATNMAAQGATVLFIPTNNGLPPERPHAKLVARAREMDIQTAIENKMWIIRADVAGRTDALVSHGSSEIVDPDGRVVQTAQHFSEDLLVAECIFPA